MTDDTLKLAPGETPDTEHEEPRPIYPLGLPKGSIRAMTAILVFLTSAILMMAQKSVPVEFNMTLILALTYYFANRQKHNTETCAKKAASPLWLPRGSIRLLLVAGFVGLTFMVYKTAEGDFTNPIIKNNLATLALIGAYMIGHILRPAIDWVLRRIGETATSVVLGGHIRGMIALVTTIAYSLAVVFGKAGELPPHADKIFLVIVGFYFGNRN